MAGKIKDGYEVTSKSIESKLGEQKRGSQEEKFLKKLKEEKYKTHLKKEEEALHSLTPQQIKQQEQIQMQLIAEKSLREQEEKRKNKEAKEQEGIILVPNSVAEIEFIESKKFNLGATPQTSATKPQAINLQSKEIAKYHGNENSGVSI